MVVAIVGSRGFNNPVVMALVMANTTWNITKVVSGGAKGADSLGVAWAKEQGILVDEYIPNWSKYGKSAGFKRNKNIVDAADALIAFWDGESRGTAHSISLARTRNIPVIVYNYKSGQLDI